MTGIARLEMGQLGSDGRRAYTAVDSAGGRWQGVLDEPELVDDYLGYLDSLGRKRPVITGPKPAAITGRERSVMAGVGDTRLRAARGAPAVEPTPVPREQVGYLVATAGRAPSVHNTQPWRFHVTANALELYADPARGLRRSDPTGREMLISCGAALFGLRLAARRLGHAPVVQLLPSVANRDLLARVQLGARVRMAASEKALLTAIARRHTHRGPFSPEPLPRGMLAVLQRDALREGATLVLPDRPGAQQLARLVGTAERLQRADPIARAERRRWTRRPGSAARDGVPAGGYPAVPARPRGGLALRDFDLGRGWGRLGGGGYSPATTAVLITTGDDRADWLRAGQALHRLLLRAATGWVFASLHTQPLEHPPLRAELRTRLGLPGAPQMLLQLGRSGVAQATARRPVTDLLIER